MRLFILLFPAIFCLILDGCERLDSPFGRTPPGGGTGRNSGLIPGDSSAYFPPSTDTVTWACAVKVPAGYDWMQDTLAGRFPGELLFYRSGHMILSIPLGGTLPVSPDPGSHHIMGGHLYTECCSGGVLHILRDGVPLLHLPGEGFLKGLLVREDGSIWTLVCTPANGSLTLRRNNETVIRIAHGTAVGGMGESRCALYEDAGHVCFEYTEGGRLFSVRDDGISLISPPEESSAAADFRWWHGEPVILFKKYDAYYLYMKGVVSLIANSRRVASLVEAGGELHVFGMSNYLVRNIVFSASVDKRELKFFYGRDSWLHCSEGGLFTVQGSGPLCISGWSASPNQDIPREEREGMLVFTDECVSSIGRDPYLGVSVPGGRPLLIRGSRVVGEFPFDGYITAVDVELTAPSL